jgi:hypothetical protein
MDTDYIYSSDDDVLMVTEYNFSYVKISLGQETTTTRIPLVWQCHFIHIKNLYKRFVQWFS